MKRFRTTIRSPHLAFLSWSALAAFALFVLTAQSTGALAPSATFVVNTADDTDDGVCSIKHCTLREAINAANATKQADTIHFDISAIGPPHIRVATQLPNISQPVTIDGYSQPGASPSTTAAGSNAVLNIFLEPEHHPIENLILSGLNITGGGTTIRGLVIGGFYHVEVEEPGIYETGVAIGVYSSGNTIEGNFIGAGITDTFVRENYLGIFVGESENNIIGGPTRAARNVISGNHASAISIQGAGGALSHLVSNNYIGTDASGLLARGNVGDGIHIYSTNNIRIEHNLIADNAIGIHLDEATDVGIYDNTIGTGRTREPLPNHLQGIYIGHFVSGVKIGGRHKGQANRIFYNGQEGIVFAVLEKDAEVHAVTISGNKIGGNGSTTEARGILLQAGTTTPNDPLDADDGANGLQNHPVLNRANSATGRIKGLINTNPGTTVRIEFFESRFCDPSLYGEGERYLGSVKALTDAAGEARFTADVAPFFEGRAITATATSKNGSTSEFSPCFMAR